MPATNSRIAVLRNRVQISNTKHNLQGPDRTSGASAILSN